jgi:hypothetical protein
LALDRLLRISAHPGVGFRWQEAGLRRAATGDAFDRWAETDLLVPTCGASAVLLALYGLAALAAPWLGPGSAPVAAALDPARAGSLPDLWGLAQLAIATGAILLAGGRCGCARQPLLALLPGILLLADATDAASWLAAPIGPSAKLAAGILLGGATLLPVWAARRRSCIGCRSLARRLLVLLLLAGPWVLALDVSGGWIKHLASGHALAHALAVLEEGGELLLYAALAAAALAHLVETLQPECPVSRLVFCTTSFARAGLGDRSGKATSLRQETSPVF